MLHLVKPPIPPLPIHEERFSAQNLVTRCIEMITLHHSTHDVRKAKNFHLFCTEQWLSFEEWNDLGQKINPSPNHIYESCIG